MTNKKLVLVIALFASCAVFAKSPVETQVVHVIDVHDGDTITYTYQNETLKGRLLHVDAPELKQPYGIESRDWLIDQVMDKYIIIKSTGKDLYGRNLIELPVGIQSDMVLYGYAWAYDKTFSMEESEASKTERGLWCCNPINPKDWRKGNRPTTQ